MTQQEATEEPPQMRRWEIWRDYQAPLDEVRAALAQRVWTRYRPNEAGSGPTRISFQTGMSIWSYAGQDMVIDLQRLRVGTRVLVRGHIRKGFQVYDWGEAEKIARKVFEMMDRSPDWSGRVLAGNLHNPVRRQAHALLLLPMAAIVLAVLFLWFLAVVAATG